MDWNKRPQPHAQVATRIVDGSAVIVLADSGEVIVLNAVGTRVWQLADGTRTLGEIVTTIQAEYTVSLEQAQTDVEAFVNKLLKANALLLNDPTTE
ncbi:MAG: PqqD family protein [Chloroflexi bacterium]|nr:PqqD family protein [Chloroflexota bacterium]